jgi:hypothetical protein
VLDSVQSFARPNVPKTSCTRSSSSSSSSTSRTKKRICGNQDSAGETMDRLLMVHIAHKHSLGEREHPHDDIQKLGRYLPF